jgi:GABA permease
MTTSAGSGARPRRVLVIANETCAARGVVDEVRYRGGPGAEVMVVAPALARGRLEPWLSSDSERRRADALERLDASVTAFTDAGIPAQGALGDADPMQALDDALRTFDPDEVIISTHPPQRSNWLERQVVAKARERYRRAPHPPPPRPPPPAARPRGGRPRPPCRARAGRRARPPAARLPRQ